jgi:hypothetical protein
MVTGMWPLKSKTPDFASGDIYATSSGERVAFFYILPLMKLSTF